MSKWERFHFEERIIDILRDVSTGEHHLGRSFLTPYQIAIEYKQRYRTDFDQIGLPVGGEGVGQYNSLAQYIGGQLSRKIRNGELSQRIEGGFLSGSHVSRLSLADYGSEVVASSFSAGGDLSIFRLIR